MIVYGVALATVGRTREALETFARARAVDPANGLPLANAGTLYLMTGDRDRASAAFEEALAVDPTLARAHNGLGVIDAERRDYPAALAHWRRAAQLNPHDFQTLFNLGDLADHDGPPCRGPSWYWKRKPRHRPRPTVDLSDRARVQRLAIQSAVERRIKPHKIGPLS